MAQESFLDLCGTLCPMNFVRIKLALEGLTPGTVLEVRLDAGPVARDLSRSLAGQGYRVLSLEETGEEALLRVSR